MGDDDLVHAYAREAVDDFLAAAESERERLRATIADAEARTRRARAAVGMHRVMVGMLLETQQQLAGLRDQAEAEAAEILARAEDEAQRILRDARADAGVAVDRSTFGSTAAPAAESDDREPAPEPTPMSAPTVSGNATDVARPDDDRMLDLTSFERNSAPPLAATSSFASLSASAIADSRDDDRFFAYLRGALADERPLGPRFD